MDGFLMVISTDCKILYLSETVHDHLGLNWVRSKINSQKLKISDRLIFRAQQ